MNETKNKILVCYEDIIDHHFYYPRFARNPQNEEEWLVSIPFELNIEGGPGLHRVPVEKKDGDVLSIILKKWVCRTEYANLWSFYSSQDVEFYNSSDLVPEEEIDPDEGPMGRAARLIKGLLEG